MSTRRTVQAHDVIAKHLATGGCAIDATVGNGHDTLFLASCVGAQGKVFGFDIQSAAIDATGRRLQALGEQQRGEIAQEIALYQASHADMAHHVPQEIHGHIHAIMFNLGYLPGCDHTLTTQVETTLAAVRAAGRLLAPGGVLSVLAYPGHAAGREELEQLLSFMQRGEDQIQWHEHDPREAAPDTAPRLFVGKKVD
ncbi:MAG: class I SAM-dependent methyltransferase [Gammaproteobacteria bacterium]